MTTPLDLTEEEQQSVDIIAGAGAEQALAATPVIIDGVRTVVLGALIPTATGEDFFPLAEVLTPAWAATYARIVGFQLNTPSSMPGASTGSATTRTAGGNGFADVTARR